MPLSYNIIKGFIEPMDILVATLQSKSLIGKLPLRPLEPTTIFQFSL